MMQSWLPPIEIVQKCVLGVLIDVMNVTPTAMFHTQFTDNLDYAGSARYWVISRRQDTRGKALKMEKLWED